MRAAENHLGRAGAQPARPARGGWGGFWPTAPEGARGAGALGAHPSRHALRNCDIRPARAESKKTRALMAGGAAWENQPSSATCEARSWN